MARLKTKEDCTIRLTEGEYEKLLRDSMMLKALIIAGIEEMPIYNAMLSIMNNKQVSVDIKHLK